MSMLLRGMYELIVKVEKPILGRWNLKSCNEISTSINSVYQNRDHCGDVICKTPKKASEYSDLKESKCLRLEVSNTSGTD